MSTKTTFKRIALVAVAALGFGLISVAPSSAAGFDTNTGNTETVSVSAAVDGVALRVGVSSQIKVTFTGPAVTAYADDSATVSTSTGGYSATSIKVMPNMRVLSAPASATTTTITAATAAANMAVGDAFVNNLSGNGLTGTGPLGAALAVSAAHQPTVAAGIRWTHHTLVHTHSYSGMTLTKMVYWVLRSTQSLLSQLLMELDQLQLLPLSTTVLRLELLIQQ